jgi:RimJ/RimL family protein N-acetyltransferase
MSAVLEAQFQCVPYFVERDNFPPDTLRLIYRKMVAQGIDREFLHNGSIDEEEFVRFASEDALTSIFIDMAGGFAGIAWVSNVEETETMKKGLGAFAFFKEYWHPEVSKAFGDICLGHWFNVLEFDLIYGITPVQNRPARRYCQRLGFEYSAKIPGFVSYRGKTVDAMVATMTREQFNAKA